MHFRPYDAHSASSEHQITQVHAPLPTRTCRRPTARSKMKWKRHPVEEGRVQRPLQSQLSPPLRFLPRLPRRLALPSGHRIQRSLRRLPSRRLFPSRHPIRCCRPRPPSRSNRIRCPNHTHSDNKLRDISPLAAPKP